MTIITPPFPEQTIEEDERLEVELWYPDLRGGPTKESVRIELMHVRAADAITIRYDGGRDGWVIYMDKTREGAYGSEVVVENEEVAFIPAWNEA